MYSISICKYTMCPASLYRVCGNVTKHHVYLLDFIMLSLQHFTIILWYHVLSSLNQEVTFARHAKQTVL